MIEYYYMVWMVSKRQWQEALNINILKWIFFLAHGQDEWGTAFSKEAVKKNGGQ